MELAKLKPALIIKILIPIIILFFFIICEISSFSEISEPIRFSDTKVFERVSRQNITSSEFYTNGRPFFTPLVYKIVGKNIYSIFILQSTASVLCWFLFAFIVSKEVKNIVLKYLFLSALCLLSLAVPVNQWDAILLSESLSISMTLLIIGTSIVLFRRIQQGYSGVFDWALWAIWGVLCFFFTGTRDSNTYTLWLLFLAYFTWFILIFASSISKEQKFVASPALSVGWNANV